MFGRERMTIKIIEVAYLGSHDVYLSNYRMDGMLSKVLKEGERIDDFFKKIRANIR